MCIQQLLDAIRSLGKRDSVRARRQQLADIDWICSDEIDHLFTFENVCAAVGINAQACREKLKPLMSIGVIDERMRESLKELEDELRNARGNVGISRKVDGKLNYKTKRIKRRTKAKPRTEERDAA